MTQIKQMLVRLKKPSVTLSIVSQLISVAILMGYNLNENKIMAIATILCSVLVTLGIMHNPDTQKKGYGDDLVTCSSCGKTSSHILVNGKLICPDCGTTQGEVVAEAVQTVAELAGESTKAEETPGDNPIP